MEPGSLRGKILEIRGIGAACDHVSGSAVLSLSMGNSLENPDSAAPESRLVGHSRGTGSQFPGLRIGGITPPRLPSNTSLAVDSPASSAVIRCDTFEGGENPVQSILKESCTVVHVVPGFSRNNLEIV